MTGWRQKTLSLAGRTVLIKSIAMAIPSYSMQTILLPLGLCDKMDKHIRKFWWGFGEQKRGLFLRAWDLICTPKLVGGLGLRRMRDMNMAFTTKLGWNLARVSNYSDTINLPPNIFCDGKDSNITFVDDKYNG